MTEDQAWIIYVDFCFSLVYFRFVVCFARTVRNMQPSADEGHLVENGFVEATAPHSLSCPLPVCRKCSSVTGICQLISLEDLSNK